jgi:hypothetical protein
MWQARQQEEDLKKELDRCGNNLFTKYWKEDG